MNLLSLFGICPECGWPKWAKRNPVFIRDNICCFAMWLEGRCKLCGSQIGGETIKSKFVQRIFGQLKLGNMKLYIPRGYHDIRLGVKKNEKI